MPWLMGAQRHHTIRVARQTVRVTRAGGVVADQQLRSPPFIRPMRLVLPPSFFLQVS